MSVKTSVIKLERWLRERPGLIRRIVRIRPGEPEPKNVPPDTLVVRTRVVSTKEGDHAEQDRSRA